jgi:hypothetical protein
MKMLKNLFASLLFAVLTFTASAQVTHIISRDDPNTIIAYPIGWSTDTRTLNVIASVGDTLRFVDTHTYSTLVMFRKSPSSNFVISDWNLQAGGYPTSIPYDYVVSVNDTAYVFSAGLNGTYYMYGKITMPSVTSVKENSSATNIKLLPNPATKVVQVTTIDKANLIVFTTTGQVVITTTVNAGTTDIDVSKLTSGLYYVKIGDAVSKLIKE